MLHQGLKSIAALRRGLEVLHTMDQMSAVTLAELHHQTFIPKASLLRILKTLQECGWVMRNQTDDRYVRTPAPGRPEAKVAQWSSLTALAAGPRAVLQRKIPWPCDLAVRDGASMLVLETHRPLAGLTVNYRVIGFRPHMLASALGRCYLAFCPDGERKVMLAAMARSPRAVDQASRQGHVVQRMVAQVRAQGYASRDLHAVGADTQMTQRFGAIAVPVLHGDGVAACISCAWLSAIASEKDVVQNHLGELLAAAGGIAEKLREARFPVY